MAEAFYIGMDLCSDFTQLSYYNDITREPESISQLNDVETYLMPNILFYSTKTEHWYVGGEASEARFSEDGVIIEFHRLLRIDRSDIQVAYTRT